MADDLSQYGTRTITALFDSAEAATRAVERLRAAGITDHVVHTPGAGTSYVGAAGSDMSADYGTQHKGFWDSLGDFFFPDEDRYAYSNNLARGGHLVTVSNYDAEDYDTIIDILDDEGSVDLDARESELRSSGNYTDFRSSSYYDEDEYNRTHRSTGITGAVSGAIGGAAAAVGDALTGSDRDRGTIYDDGRQSSSYQMAADMGGRSTADMGSMQAGTSMAGHAHHAGHRDDEQLNADGTVKVIEEDIAVGKRAVEAGAVRVRSYVREEPVSAAVDLRQTRVNVVRRPVDRPVMAGDLNMADQVIEARETREEAVVAKTARVVEEIGLQQETEVQRQVVQDTVRKTEVEIEDTRTGQTTRITGDDTRGGSGHGSSGHGSSGSGSSGSGY